MRYILVDNGSLRADSVLNLRRVARRLGAATGLEITPASLLHSSKVPAEELEGEPAVNFERRLRWCLEAGEREFTVIPFFFGPSAAISGYMVERVAFRRRKHGDFAVWRTPYLGDADSRHGPDDLVEILADRVREVIAGERLVRPKVALVDHGSPLQTVTAVRDRLALALGGTLGDAVAAVAPCSMERREGEAYAFNEPLLERLLDRPGWDCGEVVVAMLFLSPGRHAGPGGDIDVICKAAAARHPGLRTHMTGLVGDHAGIVPLLQRRLEADRVRL
jgi:sirohydrochlorin ferrochelatase